MAKYWCSNLIKSWAYPSYKDLVTKDLEAARMSHTQKQSLEVKTLPENLRVLAKLLPLDLSLVDGIQSLARTEWVPCPT